MTPVRVARLLSLLAIGTAAFAGGDPPSEYKVKAAFLYNFARFVVWPQHSFKSADEPIHVCLIGEDPFGRVLDDVINGKEIGGRPLVAVRVSEVRDAAGCQILFISSSEQKHLKGILSAFQTSSILTVGDTERFAEDGGVVNLKVDEGKVRLEINVKAGERAGLQISSKLLSLARIVK